MKWSVSLIHIILINWNIENFINKNKNINNNIKNITKITYNISNNNDNDNDINRNDIIKIKK